MQRSFCNILTCKLWQIVVQHHIRLFHCAAPADREYDDETLSNISVNLTPLTSIFPRLIQK